MGAHLRYYSKSKIQNRFVVELSIYEVGKSAKYPDGIKYGLICKDLKTGDYVLLDNHHPKGPHVHIGNREFLYEYVDDDKLIEDFRASERVRSEIMKKLIVSINASNQSLSDFKKALKEARKGRLRGDHYELSFDTKKEFDRFVKNLGVLSAILVHKPKSVYELAKIVEMDVSNLNKLVSFFEVIGVVKIKSAKVNGRAVKTPVVEYDQIEFDLKAAS